MQLYYQRILLNSMNQTWYLSMINKENKFSMKCIKLNAKWNKKRWAQIVYSKHETYGWTCEIKFKIGIGKIMITLCFKKG